MGRKKNKQKILFLICEGDSDDITLHRSLKNYFSQYVKNIIVEVTQGDLAYKEGISDKNCVEYVGNILKEHKQKNYLFSTDYIAVAHIIDTDGAFMNKENIIEDETLSSNMFKNEYLLTNNREFMLKRFENKKAIYAKLFVTNYIYGIKYYKFYFSRNLEHALYGIENATVADKIRLSNLFDETYKLDAINFEYKLRDIMNEVPNDYNESWNYILTGNNYIKRCSNISIILDLIKEDVESS